MLKIIFQSEFSSLSQSWQNMNLVNDARGGTAYEYQVLLALKQDHQIDVDPLAARSLTERSLHYAYRLSRLKNNADMLLKTPAVVLYGKNSSKIKQIAIVHHIYLDEKYSSWKGRLSLTVLQQRLKKMNCVVTVSEYWHNYFLKIGCENVKTIYNSFNLDEYSTTAAEVDEFRAKYQLCNGKPIIYLGLDEYGKGVREVYKALKDYDYHFITTGKSEKETELPIKRMYLSKREYICLLAAADLTVLMPSIEEGWSRVAHESLLCKTPVIGSGIAGMQELLEKGKQIVCPNMNELPLLVVKALKDRQQLVNDGYEYVKQFDLTYFNREWQSLVNSI